MSQGKDGGKSTTYRPPIKDVPGIKPQFIHWVKEQQGNSHNTATTYWSRIKEFPYFDLNDWEDKPYFGEADFEPNEIKEALERRLEKHERNREAKVTEALESLLLDKITDKHEKSVVASYMEFLHYTYKEDESIDEFYGKEIRTRKIHLKTTLKDMKFKKGNDKPNVKTHYLFPHQFIDLLKEADSERARFWATLYTLGCRYGELKQLEPKDVIAKEDSGYKHGHIYISEEKSKSSNGRKVPFQSELGYRLLKDAPTGEYTNEEGVTYENAYFPDRNNDTENYHLGRWHRKENGEKVLYGTIADVESIEGTRTIHSFRHMRVTDLVNDDWYNLTVDKVRRRTGHEDMATTKHYTETSLRKRPQGLESYWDENHDGKVIWLDFIKEVIKK